MVYIQDEIDWLVSPERSALPLKMLAQLIVMASSTNGKSYLRTVLLRGHGFHGIYKGGNPRNHDQKSAPVDPGHQGNDSWF